LKSTLRTGTGPTVSAYRLGAKNEVFTLKGPATPGLDTGG
jgi:hypothetical protein